MALFLAVAATLTIRLTLCTVIVCVVATITTLMWVSLAMFSHSIVGPTSEGLSLAVVCRALLGLASEFLEYPAVRFVCSGEFERVFRWELPSSSVEENFELEFLYVGTCDDLSITDWRFCRNCIAWLVSSASFWGQLFRLLIVGTVSRFRFPQTRIVRHWTCR